MLKYFKKNVNFVSNNIRYNKYQDIYCLSKRNKMNLKSSRWHNSIQNAVLILRGTSTDVVCFVLSHCHIIYQTICSILHTIYSVYSQLYPVFPEIWLVLFNAKCSRAVPLNHKFLFITHEFFSNILLLLFFVWRPRYKRESISEKGDSENGRVPEG